MRIGELAGIVGVTTRAIRHYHHLGLLPEPERLPNGYREYGLRHAAALARVRRLTELGLGLTEIRDVLADDAGRDLAEVLAELDADLARQEAVIKKRRERLRSLSADAAEGRLPAEGPVSAEVAAVFREMERSTAAGTRPESAIATKDREVLVFLDAAFHDSAAAPPGDRDRFLAALRPALGTPGAADRAHEVYTMLDALADHVDLADPATERAVDEAAHALADALADAFGDALPAAPLAGPGAEPEPGAGAETEAGAEPEAGARPDPGAEPKPDAEPEADAKPKPDAEPEAGAEPDPGAEPKPNAQPEADAKREPDPKPKPDPEPEPVVGGSPEAKAFLGAVFADLAPAQAEAVRRAVGLLSAAERGGTE